MCRQPRAAGVSAWTVQKQHPLRGRYERVLRVLEPELQTVDPSSRRVTNRVWFTDVRSVETRGRELLIALAGGCDLCGLLRREVRLLFDTAPHAAAAAAAVRSRLVRHLTAEDSEHARVLSAEAAVLSAAPRDLSTPEAHGGGSGSGSGGAGSGGAGGVAAHERAVSEREDSSPTIGDDELLTFDVMVRIYKARNLPPPPALCGGPMVSCRWGDSTDAVAPSGAFVPRRGSPDAALRTTPTASPAVISHAAATLSSAATSLPSTVSAAAAARSRSTSGGGGSTGGGLSAGGRGSPGVMSPLMHSGSAAYGSGGAASCGGASDVVSRCDSEWCPSEEGGDGSGERYADERQLAAPVAFTTPAGEADPCNPRWNFEACFRYAAPVGMLRSRRLVITIQHARWPLGEVVEVRRRRLGPDASPSGSHPAAGRPQARHLPTIGHAISLSLSLVCARRVHMCVAADGGLTLPSRCPHTALTLPSRCPPERCRAGGLVPRVADGHRAGPE